MKYLSLLLFYLVFATNPLNAQVQIGPDILGESSQEKFGSSTAISADGSTIAISADRYSNVTGEVRIYNLSGNSWIPKGQYITGYSFQGGFGRAIAMSADGNILAAGSPYVQHFQSQDVGKTQVYAFDGSDWTQLGQDIFGDEVNDNFGSVISIAGNGNVVAIGSMSHDVSRGHVKVFSYDGASWVQVGLDIDGEAVFDRSGTTISLSYSGDIIAIGAPLNDGNGQAAGHARIFEFNGSNWIQKGQDIEGIVEDDNFGTSLSMSSDGNKVAIGGYGEGSFNAPFTRYTKVFEFDGANWLQTVPIIDNINSGLLGIPVALSSEQNVVVMGAPLHESSKGQVAVVGLGDNYWAQIGGGIDGSANNDLFGSSLSISSDGKTILVGAPINPVSSSAGFARVYKINGIVGKAFLDINENCNIDEGELSVANRTLTINPGNHVIQTDPAGNWFMESLPTGNYTIALDTTLWRPSCPSSLNFTITNPDTILLLAPIGLVSKYPCPAPDISIDMPLIRPCLSNQTIYVQACNAVTATGTLNNATAEVTLDSLLIPTSFELPYVDLGNNQYLFDLDSLIPGQCIDFWIKAAVDCNVERGQAVCLEAALFPVDPCVLDSIPNPFPPTVDSCTTAWDHSSLSVIGYCQNDTVYFEITNTGDLIGGDMTCFSPVSIYVDGVLIIIDSLQLLGQETHVYNFPASGESWHLEVEQHPLHPGNSHPRATVENCGAFSGETKVNLFAMDDADPVIDRYCGPVTGSFDPNDKTGYPLGLSEAHLIKPNQPLQYRIRFQNTGTDTAFTVVIRDTLDVDLDMLSLRSGVASHAYDFRLYGSNVLEWTFNNIMLPDSNVNEPLSHGFVTFWVDQLRDLPDGTQITNSAGIYFDFNPPIITNVAEHEISDKLPVAVAVEEIIPADKKIILYPNPNKGQFFIDLQQEYKEISIAVVDISGRVISRNSYENRSIVDLKIAQASGVYFLKVMLNNNQIEVLKVLKQ